MGTRAAATTVFAYAHVPSRPGGTDPAEGDRMADG